MLSCFPDAPLTGLSPKVKSVVRSRFGKLGYLFHGPALRRTISDERPDIVHAHFASGYGFLCSTWLKRESYILSIWGADIFEFPTGPVRRRVFVRNLAHAGQLLSTSVCMVMEARKYTDRSVHLTPFGADLSMFRPFRPRRRNGDTFRIGTARVLDYKYGVDTLIKAFAIFRNACWGHDVQLLIAGDGPDRDMLERLAADLGVADGVTFVGWLHHDQLPSFSTAWTYSAHSADWTVKASEWPCLRRRRAAFRLSDRTLAVFRRPSSMEKLVCWSVRSRPGRRLNV